MKIAYFITPHGFGHASRAAAVMAELSQQLPKVRFEIFTTCPSWIFKNSLIYANGNNMQLPFGYHQVLTDIGLVQLSPLDEDLSATCRKLDQFIPFDDSLVDQLAGQLTSLNCRLVICDIAALGISAARKAGIPSMLVENFTWDWIYEAYTTSTPGLKAHADFLHAIYQQADYHIQTEPVCHPTSADLLTGPICRKPRSTPLQVRQRLQIPPGAPMILLSMGGVTDRFDFLSYLNDELNAYLVIPGANGLQTNHPKVIPLATHSNHFHPDLIHAADVLVGKAGYSTIAEAFHTGVPFGYITRPQFPESIFLERFIDRHIPALPIATKDYQNGRWLHSLPELLALDRRPGNTANGAEAVACFIQQKFAAPEKDSIP